MQLKVATCVTAVNYLSFFWHLCDHLLHPPPGRFFLAPTVRKSNPVLPFVPTVEYYLPFHAYLILGVWDHPGFFNTFDGILNAWCTKQWDACVMTLKMDNKIPAWIGNPRLGRKYSVPETIKKGKNIFMARENILELPRPENRLRWPENPGYPNFDDLFSKFPGYPDFGDLLVGKKSGVVCFQPFFF